MPVLTPKYETDAALKGFVLRVIWHSVFVWAAAFAASVSLVVTASMVAIWLLS